MLLASSDPADTIAFLGQLIPMILAALVGRFFLKSRVVIGLVAFLGAFGAMVAAILNDGQAAFVLLLSTPIVYFAAVAGQRGH